VKLAVKTEMLTIATATTRRVSYEWRPCTPPSNWADGVRRSNFSSPLYVISLCKHTGQVTRYQRTM